MRTCPIPTASKCCRLYHQAFEVDILVRGLEAVMGLLPPPEGLIPARPASWKESDSRGDTGNAVSRERASVGR